MTQKTQKTEDDSVGDVFGSVFSSQTPQHLVDGLAGGAVDVIKGVALGVGCLGASTYAGVQSGSMGSVATGVATGVFGLLGMSLYGGFRGVQKVFQGTMNTGGALQAAADGDKIWDEGCKEFVRIDVSVLAAHLPPTDDDIFDAAKLEMLHNKKPSRPNDNVEESGPQQGEEQINTSTTTSVRRKSLYDCLGVSATAPRDEIRKAYTKKALLLHPDKNPNPQAAAEFQAVAEAYRVLSNEVLRARYDANDTTSPSADGGAHHSGDSDVNPLEELCAGRGFQPWIGRLRYLLYMHPNMKFSAKLIAQYQSRKRVRVAQFLVRLLSASSPDQCLAEARPLIDDMLSTSKIGHQLILLMAAEYANAVRHFSQSAVMREMDRMVTGTLTSLSNAATIASAAGRTALKAYRKTVEEGDMFQLVLAACAGEVQETAALAAKYALIDASASVEERQRRAANLGALSTAMSEAANARLRLETAAEDTPTSDFSAAS